MPRASTARRRGSSSRLLLSDATAPMHAYLAKTKRNPPTNRSRWYRYTVPCYASLFVWIGYYQVLAQGTINRAGLGLLVFGLLTGGLLAFAAFYLIPAILGLQTGYPLAVIGSSTFGTRGGRLLPGMLAGVVQAAWFGVAAYYAAKLVLAGLGWPAGSARLPFVTVVVIWSYGMAYLGARGLGLASRLAWALIVFPLIILVAGAFLAKEGLSLANLEVPAPLAAFNLCVDLVTAFFALAATVAPNLGAHSPNTRETVIGGILGIPVPAVVAGSLAILTVAGAKALDPGVKGFGYLAAVESLGGGLATVAPWMLLAGSIPASVFIASMFSDSFAVMMPDTPRLATTMAGATLGAGLAISGIPGDLLRFLTVAAALCAPLAGIMAADYWSHERRWPHPRAGVNYAGYGAWLLGVLCGLLPLLPIPRVFTPVTRPAALYGCVAGFVGYIVLGNIGLKPYQKHRRKRVRLDTWEEPSGPAGRSRTGRSHPH